MENKNSFFSSVGSIGVTLGVGILLSTIIAAGAFTKAKAADDVLSVTGSASVEVVSDQVKWVTSITRQVKVSGLRSGYALLAQDLRAVESFFVEHGMSTSSITISPVWMDEVYDYKPDAHTREKEYNLRQTIEVSSNDVQAVTNMSRQASVLAERGIIFQTQGLEYYHSKLPELRITLLSDAIRDAKARAVEIAEPSGQKVGPLKAASSGVVQVLPSNSVEISDYGAYDTSTIDKRVMVTVRATFNIR